MIKNSIPFTKKIGFVTEPIIALKRTIKIKPNEEVTLDLVMSVGEEKQKVYENIEKFSIKENVKKEFELSRADQTYSLISLVAVPLSLQVADTKMQRIMICQ